MRKQRRKMFQVICSVFMLIVLCVIPSNKVKAETLANQVDHTVAFGEFDQLTLQAKNPTVLKVVLKERGKIELDFSPYKILIEGQIFDEQYNHIGSWGYTYTDELHTSMLDEGTYYFRLWTEYSSNAGTYTYFAKFYPSTDAGMEICVSLKRGKSIQLGTIFTNSKDKKVTWSSSKKSVAIVSPTGKVTAKKKGTAIIKVFNASGHVSKIKIKVIA